MDMYYSMEEVAKMLKVDKQTVRNWIKSGKLKCVKLEQTIRIHKDELEKLGIKL